MSNIQKNQSPVALTKAIFDSKDNIKDLLDDERISSNWVAQYKKTTGKDDGELIFDRERILFLQKVSENQTLANCDKFSIYSSFINLALSGLTLSNDLGYIMPSFKNPTKAIFFPSWHGKKFWLSQFKDVKFVHDPQVVYDCDEFEFDRAPKVVIHKHKQPRQRPENAKFEFVWMLIEHHSKGDLFILMEAKDVYKARDRSPSYRRKPTESIWTTDFEQCVKKTCVSRAWRCYSDSDVPEGILEVVKQAEQDNAEFDEHEVIQETPVETAEEQPAVVVDEESGEVLEGL